MSIPIDLSGRVAVVTGGTRGVGFGISACLLEAGAEVVVCGRTAPDELPSAPGGDDASATPRRAHFVAADVRIEAEVDALIDFVVQRFGRLDVMIPNAGGAPYAEAASASPRFHEKVVALNLLAPLLCAQRAGRVMQGQESGGVIVFIGSVSAHRPSPGTAAYGAAKAGLRSLCETLAVEWAPKVRCVLVSASMVHTDQTEAHTGGAAGLRAAAGTVPLRRLATPRDIGNACAFLASPLADYVSGAELLLSGGGESPAYLRAVQEAMKTAPSEKPGD